MKRLIYLLPLLFLGCNTTSVANCKVAVNACSSISTERHYYACLNAAFNQVCSATKEIHHTDNSVHH